MQYFVAKKKFQVSPVPSPLALALGPLSQPPLRQLHCPSRDSRPPGVTSSSVPAQSQGHMKSLGGLTHPSPDRRMVWVGLREGVSWPTHVTWAGVGVPRPQSPVPPSPTLCEAGEQRGDLCPGWWPAFSGRGGVSLSSLCSRGGSLQQPLRSKAPREGRWVAASAPLLLWGPCSV